ncbi:MAG: N-formylglutamate amidohydrolase [Burkholderiales bacterium]
MPSRRTRSIVVSCEHGGRGVPGAYAELFAGRGDLLESHRGWDPGSLRLGRQMALALDAPFHASTTTRLLVDLNRSIGHPHLFSEVTGVLPRAARDHIVAAHYRPHRDRIEGEITRRIADGSPVIHIASHSFTPVLAGVVRRADVAWLYDPRRGRESAFAQRWMVQLAARAPELQLRRNYPYQGRGDGLTALLRKRFDDAEYLGIELEVNQRFVAQGGAVWAALRRDLVASLGAVLAA